MKVEVLLFAHPRETAGCDRLVIALDDGATYGELRQRLAEELASVAPLVASSRLAADGEFIDDDQKISEGVEVALIPPVSGG